MKKRKKSLSLLLAFSLALGSFGSAPFGFASLRNVQAAELEKESNLISGTCGAQGDNITWELVEDPDGVVFPEQSPDSQPLCYELIFTGTGELSGAKPWAYSCSSITSVTINEGITAIGDYGLSGLYNVTSITLPDSVASIGAYAFQGNHSLKTAVCGRGLVKIGNYAFDSLPSLTTVTLNEGLTEIGSFTFRKCEKMGQISLPESLVTIGESAFERTSLSSITIPSNVKKIGQGAFRQSKLNSVYLSEGLENIGAWAFSYCGNISAISLPESLSAIGDCAFYATSLSSITIPSNVEEIGSSPFPSTPLKTIRVGSGNQHFLTDSNILYEITENGSPKRAIAYAVSSTASNVEVLEGTETIDAYAFYIATNLHSATLPESLTSIRTFAFSNSGLRELHLPGSLTEIGSYAFSGCRDIQEVTIPDSVSILGEEAFSGCPALTAVTIGKSVPTLTYTFRESTNITDITVSQGNPYLESLENVVYSKDHTKLFYYAPTKPDTVYHASEPVKEIHTGAIEHASALKKLYLPKALEQINWWGIANNQNLGSIFFAGNCPTTGTYNRAIYKNAENLILYKLASSTGWEYSGLGPKLIADWDPSNTAQDSGSLGGISWEYTGSEGRLTLTGPGQLPDFSKESPAPWNLYMGAIQSVRGDDITGIGDYGFCNASKLIQVETNASLERAGSYAFSGCRSLKSINIAAIRTIGESAFAGNTSLPGNLTLEKVSSMCEGAFRGCTSISSATLGSCLTDLEKEVFENCTGLTSFLLPDSVSTIGEGAFRGCTNLRSVNIPSGTYSIGAQAFSGDASLEKVYFYGAIPANWAADSFEGCHSSLNLCYHATQTSWAKLNGAWNGIPLLKQERFYQEGEDHYSFANSTESFGYPAGYHFPKRRYWDALGNACLGTYYYVISPNWAGSCYGMAATTLEFYENPDRFPISSYSPSAGTLYGIAAPRDKDAPLTQLIESYQISQYHPLISGCTGALNTNRDDYRGLVQKIEEFERAGGLRVDSNAEPLALVLYSNFSGHVVVPVSVSQTTEGDFLVMAYNPNRPSGLETITINKDFSGIKGSYGSISYVPYHAIAAMYGMDFQSGEENFAQRSATGAQNAANTTYSATRTNAQKGGDNSLCLSIDKEQGMVTDTAGNSITGIEGAYEQKPLTDGNGDTFLGIRSFVLPEGNYQLSANTPKRGDGITNSDSVTFYMGSEECFAEISSSDEYAALMVSETGTQDGALVLELKSSSTEAETASFTLVNPQGAERNFELNSSSASITVETNDTIKIQAPGQDSITVDGEKISLQDGQAAFPFPDGTGTPDDTDPGSPDDKKPGSGGSDASGNKPGSDASGTKKPGSDASGAPNTNKPGSDASGANKPDSSSSGNSSNQGPDGTKPGTNSPNSKTPSATKREQAVTKVKVNVKKLTLGVGETYTLKASAFPANAQNKKLRYAASNKKLTVTSRGKITAKKTGSGKITVTSSNGKKATVQVTIKKKPTKLKLNAKTKTIRVGWKFQIKAKFPKGTASNKLTYTSSRNSVASVSPTGKITAKKKGIAIITVKTYNGKKAKIKIIVTKKK